MSVKIKMLMVSVAMTLCLQPMFTKAQSTFTLSPTESSTNGTLRGYSNPSNAYDGNTSTASTIALVQSAKGAVTASEKWYGFSSAPSGATGMTLNVISGATTSIGAMVSLSYSLNGGTTFSTIYHLTNTGSETTQTFSIPLSAEQDLTLIQVGASAVALTIEQGQLSTASQAIYEIWVSGTD